MQGLREKYASFVPSKIVQQMGEMAEVARALSDLSCRFLQYFGSKKRENNVIDFVDLEHFALKILARKGADGRSADSHP